MKHLFLNPKSPQHKKYEILRAAIVEETPRGQIAKKFKTTIFTVNSYVRDFKEAPDTSKFFTMPNFGRKPSDEIKKAKELIVNLRKKNLSVPDIKAIMDSRKINVSEKQINIILTNDGFSRLPRRTRNEKDASHSQVKIEAQKSSKLVLTEEQDIITSQSAGIFCFLPYLQKLGVMEAIKESKYPSTSATSKTNSILAFLALKLSNFSRYTSDDQWCMDSGLGMFAGLNVLPKSSWYTSYSHRVTREMNIGFLKSLNKIWNKQSLLSDTINLDFTTIPYWGTDSDHLNNNWSGTRNRALTSILAAIAHDPDTGIITYGDTTVDEQKDDSVLEFLDFYSNDNRNLKYLVFDGKFTTYQNLSQINQKGFRFVTIRRRGAKIVKELEALPAESLKKIKVPTAKGNREVLINESLININGYNGEIRQIAILGTKRIKPALIITNDTSLKADEIVRKYAQRWLVENEISEQIHFFHLNQLSSSIVIKVDFDLVMTILAHNLYRVLANDLHGFESATCKTIYDKFIMNSARIRVSKNKILVELKKKRNLPLILTAMHNFNNLKLELFDNRLFEIQGWTTS